MEALKIGLLLLCFNTSIAYLVGTGIFEYSTDTQQFDYTEINRSLPPVGYTPSNVGSYIFGDFLSSMGAFVTIISYSTILLPVMLNKIGLPAVFVGLFTLITWVLYGLGVVQFVSNRNEKMMR